MPRDLKDGFRGKATWSFALLPSGGSCLQVEVWVFQPCRWPGCGVMGCGEAAGVRWPLWQGHHSSEATLITGARNVKCP